MCCPDVAADLAVVVCHSEQCHDFYAKMNGAPVVLSELSQIQLNTLTWPLLPGIFQP